MSLNNCLVMKFLASDLTVREQSWWRSLSLYEWWVRLGRRWWRTCWGSARMFSNRVPSFVTEIRSWLQECSKAYQVTQTVYIKSCWGDKKRMLGDNFFTQKICKTAEINAIYYFHAVLQFAVCVFFIKMHTTLWSIHYIVRRSQNALH